MRSSAQAEGATSLSDVREAQGCPGTLGGLAAPVPSNLPSRQRKRQVYFPTVLDSDIPCFVLLPPPSGKAERAFSKVMGHAKLLRGIRLGVG